jgi:hypothetical protein
MDYTSGQAELIAQNTMYTFCREESRFKDFELKLLSGLRFSWLRFGLKLYPTIGDTGRQHESSRVMILMVSGLCVYLLYNSS